jgi:hypothetical protein
MESGVREKRFVMRVDGMTCPTGRRGASGRNCRLALHRGSVFRGLGTFWWHLTVRRWHSPVLIFDAAGLGLFAVAGPPRVLL